MKNIFHHSREFVEKHKHHHHIFFGALALIFASVSVYTYRHEFVQAATYTFTQSSWAGGLTANTATHASNQSNWTQYSATSTNITAAAGGVSLLSTSKSITDDGFSGIFAYVGTAPRSILSDSSDNLYVSNYNLRTISKITPAGDVTTFASLSSNYPTSLAMDSSGNLYVALVDINTVKKITPSGSITTMGSIGGTWTLGRIVVDTAGNIFATDVTANTISKITPAGVVTTFATVGTNPQDLIFDSSGNLYVANYTSNTISKVTSDGTVTTFATVGTGPRALAFDSSGNLYVANYSSNTISKVTPGGTVTTFATTAGWNPLDIVIDSSDNLYVPNVGTNKVNKITSAGVVSVFSTVVSFDTTGKKYVTLDSYGNLYVLNTGSNTVSRMLTRGGFDAGTNSFTTLTGSGTTTSVALGYGALTPLGTPTISTASGPWGLTVSPDGTSVYVVNTNTNTVSQYSRNVSTGALTALSPATIATGVFPENIAISPDGAFVYVTNYTSGTVSQYSRNPSTGVLTALGTPTVATGTSPEGIIMSSDGTSAYVANRNSNTVSQYSRDTGTGLLTALGTPTIAAGTNPRGITISADGTSVYVTNGGSHTVSQYSRNTGTGELTALSPATIATGQNPYAIAVSPDGNSVYVANYSNSNVIQYSRNTSTGILTAMSPSTATAGASPYDGIAISADGISVYVTNSGANTVSQYRRDTSTGLLTVYGSTATTGSDPRGIKLSPDGTSAYVANRSGASVSQYSRTTSTSGTFTSAVIDAGAAAGFTTLSYTSTLNGQTLTVDVRAGNVATPDGTWTSWQTGIASGGSISGLAGNRYIQYRANLSTADPAISPALDSVTINYNQYSTSGNLTSSVYDTQDSANIVASVSWTASGTSANETVAFQIRSSADNVTWTSWCGATLCDGSNTFTTSPSTISSSHPIRSDGVADRYLQYKVFLTSGGSATPTLTQAVVQYVVNAPPSFDATYGTNGVVVSQVSDSASADWGKVSISYKVRDTDTTSGTVNPGYVTPSFEYSTDNGSNWTAISSGLAAGDTSNKTVETTNYTTHTATWDASSAVVAYNTTMKVRVTLNDNEAANSTASATSGVFTLDPAAPTVGAGNAILDSSTGGNAVGTVTLRATDNSTLQYRICNDNAFPGADAQSNSCAWTDLAASPIASSTVAWVPTGAPNAETTYLQVRDLYGNVTARTLVAPAMPANFSYSDISNTSTNTYREFLNWASSTPGTFGSYKVYHSTDGSSYSLLSTITDQAQNYYIHTITSATSSTQYYKMTSVSSSGDISNYTAVQSDVPDGSGGVDVTAPYIPFAGIATPTVGNSSVNITFSTYTDNSMTTGELATSTVRYASYVGSAPTSCPSATNSVSINTYTVNHSVYLTGLTPATNYAFCVLARDITGNVSDAALVSVAGGTFTTVSGPVISNVTEREITDTSATIFWNTNTSSDSKVYYALSTAGVNGSTPATGSIVTAAGTDGSYQHQIGLTGLISGQTYYYKVVSTDAGAVSSTDNNNGQYFSFVTLRDTNPPTITGTSTPVLSSDAAVIVWQTDELATNQVFYDTTSRAGNTAQYLNRTAIEPTMSIFHVATLSAATSRYDNITNSLVTGGNVLLPETLYYVTVKSVDAAGNGTSSSEWSFTTPSSGTVTIIQMGGSSKKGEDTSDTTAPLVTNVQVKDITPFGATVSFDTNEDTVCFTEYSKDTSYGDSVGDPAFARTHTTKLRGLTLGTEYHIRVKAVDKSGNTGTSPDQTFKTAFLSENLKDMANVENIEQFQKEIESAIESILPSLVPPFVTKPQITDITESSAIISFKTNIKAFPVVVYAEDVLYDETKENPYTSEVSETTEKSADHNLVLTGLKGNTKYHIQARAFSLPKVIGKSADITFVTKASKIAGSIVERKKDSFTVVWTTDQPTSSIVEYRNVKSGITERKTDDAKKTSHSMKIENLPSGTAYEVNLSGMTEEGNIAEAGSSLTVTTSRDITPPTISGFKVDNALVPGRTDRIQTIVSWVTDEPSNSTVYYEEGAGTAGDTSELANKNESLDSYIVNHSIILPNLKPGTIYRLKVTSSDDSGNEGSFGPRTVITPRQTESITDIIFKNFEDSFKFLRKI